MPRFNQTKDDKIIEKNQETSPGLYISTGEIEHGDYDSKDWKDLIKDYIEMINGDCVASTTVEILKYPLSNAKKNILPGDKMDNDSIEAARYVDWALEGLVNGFQYYKDHLLMAIDFGFAMHEKIIKNNDKYVTREGKSLRTNRIIKLQPIMPETIYEWHFKRGSYDLFEIIQEYREIDGGTSYPVIPIEKLDLFTYNKRFDDPRGKGVLRPVRLFYRLKKDTAIGKATATQRGAGIPAIGVMGNPGAEESKIQRVARSMQLGAQSYVSYDMNKMKIELLEPKNQADVMPFLDYLDRQMFFNTNTEFLTSGIGQNGSRAATSEHKAPYELKITNVLRLVEDHLQKLTDEIINISPYASLPKEKKPVFNLSVVTQADLTSVSNQLKTLYESVLTKREGDEDYIRKMFNFPMDNTLSGSNIQDEVKEDQEVIKEGELCGCGCGNHKLNDRKWTSREFRLEKANEVLQDIKATSESQMEMVIKKVLKDAGKQLIDNPDKPLKLRHQSEMINRMMKQFNVAFELGKEDVIAEFNKIAKKEQVRLQLTPNQERVKSNRILRSIDRLFNDIKFTLEDKVDNLTDQQKTSSSFMLGWVLTFLDKFKGSRRKVLTEVDGGYIAGRSDSNKNIAKDVRFWFYSAKLDQNLCDNCAPFDGSIFTSQEIRNNSSLSLTGENVNLGCLGLLGNNKCRCVLIPTESEVV